MTLAFLRMSPIPDAAIGGAPAGRKDERARGAWLGHARGVLAAAGRRRGGAREAVLELLASESCALAALDIEQRLHSSGARAGRASVYRVLEELVEHGLVQRLELGGGVARYERSEPGGEHHHHLLCGDCGRLIPFADRELERSIARLGERQGFRVREHEIVLRGACGGCAS